MKSFLKIAFTHPDFWHKEEIRIAEILESKEADFVHIRKPDWGIDELRNLILRIPVRFYPRLRIHDHFSLTDEFNLAGVHLNSRNPIPPENAKSISKSCHSFEQLDDIEHFSYVTLSPIYDSISKIGYKSHFDIKELKPIITGKNIVALGGVTPEKFPELQETGFIGAAMLGYYFNNKM